MRITGLAFNGENFAEVDEFTGPEVHMTYNAFDELSLVKKSGEILLSGIKAGDKIAKKDGQFIKIEK